MAGFYLYIAKNDPYYGETVLDAKNFQFYLFFKKDLYPSEEDLVFLETVYKNRISKYVEIGFFELIDEIGVFKKGYGLKLDGIGAKVLHKPVPSDRKFNWSDNVEEYIKLLKKSGSTGEEIKKVIVVKLKCKSQKHEKCCKFAALQFEFRVCLQIKNPGRDIMYYKVPEDKYTKETYIPQDSDIVDLGDGVVIPYSKEKYKELEALVDTQDKINKNIWEIVHGI